MKKIIISALPFVLIGILLTGCGASNTKASTNSTWVTVWNGEAHPVNYFTVGSTKVPTKDIGKYYEVVSNDTYGFQVTSNRLSQGTKLYTIQGENPLKKLAVKIGEDNFVKATYYGTKKP